MFVLLSLLCSTYHCWCLADIRDTGRSCESRSWRGAVTHDSRSVSQVRVGQPVHRQTLHSRRRTRSHGNLVIPGWNPQKMNNLFLKTTAVRAMDNVSSEHYFPGIFPGGLTNTDRFQQVKTVCRTSGTVPGVFVSRVPTAPGKPGKTGPDLENLENLEKQGVLGQKPGKILQNLEKNFDLTLKKLKSLNGKVQFKNMLSLFKLFATSKNINL